MEIEKLPENWDTLRKAEMEMEKLPENWSISNFTIDLTDWTDTHNPQMVEITFKNEGSSFYPTIKIVRPNDAGIKMNPDELVKMSKWIENFSLKLDKMLPDSAS